MSKRAPAEAPEARSSDVISKGAQFGDYFGAQQQALLRNAGEFLEDGWRFAGARMAATADYLHALRDCTSAPDWVALNNGFFAAAMDDIARQAERLLGRVRANGG